MIRAVRHAAPLLFLTLAGCAVRLGGPAPQPFEAMAIHALPNATPADVATQVRNAGGELVLLSGTQDSAWFAQVAAETGLTLSGPGRTGERGMAFLSNLEVLGDTSLVLQVPGGGSVHMHDALLQINGERYIDLLMVSFDAPDLSAAVQTLLRYVATDVMPNVPVLFAIDGPTVEVAESATRLIRVHYAPTTECPGANRLEAVAQVPIRLLFGPSARIACRSARALGGTAPGVHARVVVAR